MNQNGINVALYLFVIIYIFEIPLFMTKYFDKLLKIKFYISCYPSHGNMENNAILGHVDF
jgi:hypothetical protein